MIFFFPKGKNRFWVIKKKKFLIFFQKCDQSQKTIFYDKLKGISTSEEINRLLFVVKSWLLNDCDLTNCDERNATQNDNNKK